MAIFIIATTMLLSLAVKSPEAYARPDGVQVDLDADSASITDTEQAKEIPIAGPANVGASPSDPCTYRPYDHQPAAGDPTWDGHDPSKFTIVWRTCPTGFAAESTVTEKAFLSIGVVIPPPDPALLAAQAIARLPIPLEPAHIGPNRDMVAVHMPIWLWVDNPGTLTESAADRGLSVSVSATLATTTFTMGEPDSPPVTCAGSGVAPSPNVDISKPVCGFTYTLQSLPERTGGRGKWTLTTATTWDITWTASSGQAGTDTITRVASDLIYVGSWRSVLIDAPQ